MRNRRKLVICGFDRCRLGYGRGLPAPFPGSGRPREALTEICVEHVSATDQTRSGSCLGLGMDESSRWLAGDEHEKGALLLKVTPGGVAGVIHSDGQQVNT